MALVNGNPWYFRDPPPKGRRFRAALPLVFGLALGTAESKVGSVTASEKALRLPGRGQRDSTRDFFWPKLF